MADSPDDIVGHKTMAGGRHEPLTRGEADRILAAVEAAKKLRALARASLRDFEYPTEEHRREAIGALASEIEEAIDAWIQENCHF